MKISFITTVFNEEKTIRKFLDSLITQIKLPDEIIIVDGGSKDRTVEVIKSSSHQFAKQGKLKRITFKVLVKKGNRSVGRNEAIKIATGDIIVCSDAGNILDKNWIKNIIKPFSNPTVDVVAGYYKGHAKNIFQKCLIPYVLVMPDRTDPDNFLPATRSIAFKKKVWKKTGGFDERLSHNEDYVFANKLKDIKAHMVFKKDAIVNWVPRDSFKKAFIMFFRFALGDVESGILRTNVLLLFARYSLGLYLVFLSLLYKSFSPISVLVICVLIYILWAIKKNYKYINDKRAIGLLPLLQFTADGAVLLGSIAGGLKRIVNFNYLLYAKQNKFLIFFIFIYACIVLLTLQWGIPNQNHPFNYQMDEWHQSQAVRTVFTQGTPNVEGSANGSMFHFVLAGFYLIPFIFLGVINPFEINSSVGSLDLQQRLFEVFRMNTIFYGILAIITLAHIGKKYFKIHSGLVAFIFIFNPMWLLFSNYFKYDIALIFWILLAFLTLLRFMNSPTIKNYFIAGVVCAVAFAVKLSAFPLFIAYSLFGLIYLHSLKKKYLILLAGVVIYLSIFSLLGIPDIMFGKGDIYEYLDSNLNRSPAATSNYIFGTNYLQFLITKLYPYHFGHVMYAISIISIIYFLVWFFKKSFSKNYSDFLKKMISHKVYFLLLVTFLLFLVSLIPLKIEARSNRVLVLLPFLVIFIGIFLTKINKSVSKIWSRFLLILIISIFVVVQLFEVFGWVWVKIAPDPRITSSEWIEKNIKEGTVIGIEDIPIYQMLPDILVKEFYYKKYGVVSENKFQYQVVNVESSVLPQIVIISNAQAESRYLYLSTKKDLIKRLEKENYKKIIEFKPDFRFYSIFGNDHIFYMANLVSSPTTITIFSNDY